MGTKPIIIKLGNNPNAKKCIKINSLKIFIFLHIYIMESDNIVIGKINKKKVYLNNGKYGHYLNHDGKNYKVPEWFPVDKFDIDVAERLIEYKKKMSEMYCEESSSKKPTKANKSSKKEESDSDEEESPKLRKKK
jgi:topoisomerase IA-like protein